MAVGGDVTQHQRVAIGRGLGHEFSRQGSTGAGLVVHDDWLFERCGQALANGAGHGVVGATGGGGHHDGDGLFRESGKDRAASQGGGHGCGKDVAA
jgi:hypothetical protein